MDLDSLAVEDGDHAKNEMDATDEKGVIDAMDERDAMNEKGVMGATDERDATHEKGVMDAMDVTEVLVQRIQQQPVQLQLVQVVQTLLLEMDQQDDPNYVSPQHLQAIVVQQHYHSWKKIIITC